MNDFTHGTTKKTENKECACTIATTTIAHMKNFEKSRRIDASTREINTAVHSPNSTIWVVAGMNHGKKAMELAKANKINIIVLAPKGMPKSFYQYQKLQSDAQVYQKDVEQVCGSISKYTNSALDTILANEVTTNTEKLRQHYANIH